MKFTEATHPVQLASSKFTLVLIGNGRTEVKILKHAAEQLNGQNKS